MSRNYGQPLYITKQTESQRQQRTKVVARTCEIPLHLLLYNATCHSPTRIAYPAIITLAVKTRLPDAATTPSSEPVESCLGQTKIFLVVSLLRP